MTTKTECTIYLAINEDGDYAVHADEVDAVDLLHEDHSDSMCRVVKLTVKIAPPALIEASVDVPDETGETVAIEAS